MKDIIMATIRHKNTQRWQRQPLDEALILAGQKAEHYEITTAAGAE